MRSLPIGAGSPRFERSSKLEKIAQAIELCQIGDSRLRLLMPSRRSSRQLMRLIQTRYSSLSYPSIKLVGLQSVPSTDLFDENFPVEDLVRDFALGDSVPGFAFDFFGNH